MLNNLSTMSVTSLVKVRYTIVGKQEYKDKTTGFLFFTNIDGVMTSVFIF